MTSTVSVSVMNPCATPAGAYICTLFSLESSAPNHVPYDVLMDIRPDSPTFGKWFGAELSGDNNVQMYAPAGVAHGFITLTDTVEVTYLVSQAYAPGQEGGIRYNDPAFNVVWPTAVTVIAPKDETWPGFQR